MVDNSLKKRSSLPYRIACNLLFTVFSFCYLYYYQSDLLAVMQNVWSQGQTHYHSLVGALLITLMLWLVQAGVYFVFRLKRHTHILTYVPSMVLLVALTSSDATSPEAVGLGAWWWLAPLLIVADGVAMFYARQLQDYTPFDTATSLLGHRAWVNYAGMLALMFVVVLLGNHNTVTHDRLRMERDIVAERYVAAEKVGENSQRTDSTLTCLRIYNLSLAGALPERLFEYPLTGRSAAMLPTAPGVHFMLCSEGKFFQHLGVWLRQPMTTLDYLRFIHRYRLATPAAHDYLLCAYLLEGDIDAFARTISRFYDLRQALPKHYREALVLYNHLRSTPVVSYRNNVVDADFSDFQTLLQQQRDPRRRLSALLDTYGNTYWAYYYRLKHGAI